MGNLPLQCADQCNRLMVDLHDMSGEPPRWQDPNEEVRLTAQNDQDGVALDPEMTQRSEPGDELPMLQPVEDEEAEEAEIATGGQDLGGRSATAGAAVGEAGRATGVPASGATSRGTGAGRGGPASGSVGAPPTAPAPAAPIKTADVKKAAAAAPPKADEDPIVAQLKQMGFSEESAKKARVGNNTFQAAMDAALAAQDDGAAPAPPPPPRKTDAEKIADLMGLGFPKAQCAGALKQARGNADAAATILLGAG
mmetsp:Transcript_10629/g.25987  ORF Transcript_10629/g.25987 Transcript_10629/m.25987 type:complete len:253 (+) Transcript_10629:91-849(+)